MSDWDLVEEKKKVPRNDPDIDRNQNFASVDSATSKVIRSGIKYYENQNLKKEPRQPRRESQSRHQRSQAKTAKQALQRFTPEEIRSRRKLRKFISQQSKTKPDSFSGTYQIDAVQLNVVNLVIFLVGSGIFTDLIDEFPGGLKIIAYIALWFIARNIARKILEKKFNSSDQ